jgi:hypothetical protein
MDASAAPNRTPRASKAMTLSLIWWGLLPLLLVIAAVDLLTMSQPRRVRMLRRSGMTQTAIADRLQASAATASAWLSPDPYPIAPLTYDPFHSFRVLRFRRRCPWAVR